MWNDLDKSVRKVAAQTLGRTGHGKEIHDELYARLQSENLKDRTEALRTINRIGVMTNKLLDVYLKCFRDDRITVRELACKSCQHLNEKDEKILEALIFMVKYEKTLKLKEQAIRSRLRL
jgi:tRNA U34 5-carboxymethylaminomethyl modifying enzyme MnmG/GidA